MAFRNYHLRSSVMTLDIRTLTNHCFLKLAGFQKCSKVHNHHFKFSAGHSNFFLMDEQIVKPKSILFRLVVAQMR